jgi:hypothetical protein
LQSFITILPFSLPLHPVFAVVTALLTGFVFVANWKADFALGPGALALRLWGKGCGHPFTCTGLHPNEGFVLPPAVVC